MTGHDISNLRIFALGFLATAAIIVIALLRKQRRDAGEWPQQWAGFMFGVTAILVTLLPMLVVGGFAAVIIRSILRWLASRG